MDNAETHKPPVMPWHGWASIAIAADADPVGMAAAAGAQVDRDSLKYEEGVLYVAGISQAALDKARKTFKPRAPVSYASGRQLRYALNASGQRQAWDDEILKSKQDYADYWTTLGSNDLAPSDNLKLGKIANRAGIDLAELFAAAVLI